MTRMFFSIIKAHGLRGNAVYSDALFLMKAESMKSWCKCAQAERNLTYIHLSLKRKKRKTFKKEGGSCQQVEEEEKYLSSPSSPLSLSLSLFLSPSLSLTSRSRKI